MKPLYAVLCFAIASFCYTNVNAQCGPGQSEIHITILSDNYPSEISWDLQDGNGNIILSGAFGNLPVNQVTTFDTTLCIMSDTCHTFHLHDNAGDGICCGYGIGNYQIEIDGAVVATGGQYGADHYDMFNCPPGASCGGAFPVTTDTSYQTPFNHTWYSFTPDVSGLYTISTCDSNATCNTMIWMYDQCSGLVWDNTNAGTMAYNDDACGEQSEVNIGLVGGNIYYIRVGSVLGTCDGLIDWNISGPAPVYGCMDPTSCNFNPMATIDSGGCILPGDPGCTSDLVVLYDQIVNSIQIDDEAASNCNVVEECMTGYGTRRIIRFTTHIQNIGQLDYYIGNPTTNPDQFTFNNCHGHAHYEGYAEYVMYKTDGTILPIGFKNGFCVIDLECWNGGSGQYGCGNMGISAGCGDYYSSGLSCQWIDITDIDTGDYVMVVRVNWDQSPDANGHYESDYENNWAQVCININQNSSGVKNFTLNADCNPFTDCAGQIYGSAQPDCEGTCNGTKVRGDLDSNAMLNLFDINGYMSGIIDSNLPVTTCNDLNADGLITVYDAALLNDCTLFGSNYALPGGGYHNYCEFPTGVYNFNDTVSFTIGEVNYDDQYVDVLVKNPNRDVNAYEFEMGGLTIESVVSLADPADYMQAYPQGQVGGTRVACYSAVDSSLNKSTTYQPLCRIYYATIADTVCISQIIDVVNNHDEQAFGQAEDACMVLYDYVSGIEAAQNIDVMPNPATNNIHVRFNLPTAAPFTLNITNALGQVVYTQERGGTLLYNENINLDFLPAGTYMLKVNGTSVNASKKIVVIR